MTGVWILIAIACVVIAIRLVSQTDTDPYGRAEAGRPKELRGAVVVEVKTKLRMTVPFPLHGEPDILYRLPDGTIVVREDKSFFPHPLADRIQASVYACILRHNPPAALRGCPVANHAWLRYGTPGKTRVRWVRVELFDDETLRRLIQRYREVRRGYNARPTADLGYCQKVCQHYRSNCRGAHRTQRVPPSAH